MQKKLEDGFKVIYNGTEKKRSGVGTILREVSKRKAVEIRRESGRTIGNKLIIKSRKMNIISAYAPQVAGKDEEKLQFFQEQENLVSSLPAEELVVVGVDLNGHVGNNRSGFGRQWPVWNGGKE